MFELESHIELSDDIDRYSGNATRNSVTIPSRQWCRCRFEVLFYW
jgi:hypothetical protein